MKRLQHHPSQELLLSFSAGSTDISQSLCVATHLEYCPACRQQHQRNNAIGGSLLDMESNETPANVSVAASTKNAVLDKIANRSAKQPPAAQLNKHDTDDGASATSVPRALRKLIPKGFDQLNWRFATTSAKNCVLAEDSGVKVGLIKIKAGGKIGKHRHLGDEYTVVLSGSFSDEDGIYKAGDFILRDAKDQHTPVATKDGECICLTVQEAPLQFTGRIMQMLNPLLRRSHAI